MQPRIQPLSLPTLITFLPDPLRRVTASAHSGWHSARGTLENIAHSSDGLKIVVCPPLGLRPGSELIPTAVFRQSLRLRPGSERRSMAVFRPSLRLSPS